MKKLFKGLSLVLLTVCTVFACAFALTACSKGYTFAIQNDDGTAYTQSDVGLQICANGECYSLENFSLDANGKLSLSQKQINEICHSETDVTVFSFHVIDAVGYEYDCSFEIDGAKEYACKLYK